MGPPLLLAFLLTPLELMFYHGLTWLIGRRLKTLLASVRVPSTRRRGTSAIGDVSDCGSGSIGNGTAGGSPHNARQPTGSIVLASSLSRNVVGKLSIVRPLQHVGVPRISATVSRSWRRSGPPTSAIRRGMVRRAPHTGVGTVRSCGSSSGSTSHATAMRSIGGIANARARPMQRTRVAVLTFASGRRITRRRLASTGSRAGTAAVAPREVVSRQQSGKRCSWRSTIAARIAAP